MDKRLPIFSFNGIPAVLIFTLLFAGCAPTIVEIYYPKADGGKVIYADFPPNSHIPTAICFSHNDIKTYIEFRKYKKSRWIKIRFEIPEGNTVRLLGDTVYAKCDECINPVKAKFNKILLGDNPSPTIDNPNFSGMDINALMTGSTTRYTETNTTHYKSFWTAVYLDVPSSKDIRISLPQFTVNGELVTLPEIHYHKKMTPAIWMFNY